VLSREIVNLADAIIETVEVVREKRAARQSSDGPAQDARNLVDKVVVIDADEVVDD